MPSTIRLLTRSIPAGGGNRECSCNNARWTWENLCEEIKHVRAHGKGIKSMITRIVWEARRKITYFCGKLRHKQHAEYYTSVNEHTKNVLFVIIRYSFRSYNFRGYNFIKCLKIRFYFTNCNVTWDRSVYRQTLYNIPNRRRNEYDLLVQRLWNIRREIIANYGGIEGSTILRLRNVWSMRSKSAALNHSREWERLVTHSSSFPGNV